MPDSAHHLGELLIEKGVIGADQLRIALQAQHQHPQSLGHVLVDLGFVERHFPLRERERQGVFDVRGRKAERGSPVAGKLDF